MDVNTQFDPNIHGFGFENRFRGGDVVTELGRQGRLTELTGLAVPKALVRLADLAAGEDFWGTFGLCGGMSWAAIDRFRREEGQPEANHSIPGPDHGIFRELVARQADSLQGRKIMERCLVWQMLPDRAPWWMIWSKGVGRITVEQEWPKLRIALDDGEPTGLVLVRARGATNPSVNHQVVAVGYQVTDSGSVEIRLYDPNHPRRRPSFSLEPTSRSVGPRQSTGEPIRGFFVSSPARAT